MVGVDWLERTTLWTRLLAVTSERSGLGKVTRLERDAGVPPAQTQIGYPQTGKQ